MTTAHIWAQLMAKDHRVGQLAGDFIVYRFIGLPFFLITVSFRGFFFGIGHTRIFMISAVIVNLLNIVFNYILIFGKFGLPAMGVAGSGLGSSLATICDSAFYIIIASTPAYRKQYHFLKNLIFSKSIVKSIFKLSLPVSFQNVFILIGFCIFVAITGLISTKAQAATQAIISTLFMSFLPCFGFGIAAQTLMGNAIGQGKNQLAKLYGYQTVTIALLFTLSIAILFLTIPQHILHVITEDHGIIDTAVPAMRIAGIAQIFYGIGIVLANSLQTLGKTSYVMFAEIITNLLILVPASYLFGVVLNWGLAGAWGAMPLYIVLYSIIVYIGYRKHNWNIKYND
jgi:putative MATE family efflux protein